MQIGATDVPEALLTAQASGQLVIFAGAGVSMPPPSNLPSLGAMASDVVDASRLSLEEGEPIDHFLGRLKEEGVRVHQKVAELVLRPSSRPTELHHNLLKLFPSVSSIRVVTTNFDTHFTTVARELFDEEVEFYYAPALPLGHDFNGIVYLHGSVGKDPEQVVLTDEDFGRAYLTEGWARRFLQNLLASYTVLFVGYSHSDPVMNYLSRGLPPEVRDLAQRRAVRRFALTPTGGQRHWEFLGTTPIEYPVSEGDDRHTSLIQSVAEWVRIMETGGLHVDARVRAIVAEPAPPEQDDDDFLSGALSEPETARAFLQSARTPAWLLWAEERGLLDPLFELRGATDPMAAEMARWFVERYMFGHPRLAVSVVRRSETVLGPDLWRAVLDGLCSPAGEALGREVRALWWELLLRSHQAQGEGALLMSRLMGSYRGPDDDALALLAFQQLATPRLDLPARGDDHPGSDGGPSPEPGIVLTEDLATLRDVWISLFRPRLPELAEMLEPILAGHLVRVRLLSRATGDEVWPPHGSEAARHSEGSHGEGLKFLLEAAEEVLDWLRENRRA